MKYKIELHPDALDDLARLDKAIAQRILRKTTWFAENFEQITPETLSGDLKGLYKLRVGSYRILYSVDTKQHLIIIHLIGHRKDIYK